jgi:acetyltransferase-like isoleucine patch superfamily enzyme
VLIEKPRIPIRDVILYGLWPGFIKILLYRLRGYRIGKGVSVGFGSVVSGEHVEIGDHTSIGFFTIIRGKEIRLGSHVQIGSTTFIDTPHIEIGEGSKINEQVFVGGLQFPDSRFVLGRNCQVMQMTFINPARSVVVGDDSGIGGHCLIFGHTSWLSQFEGYGVEFEPIEIGKSVSLAWRVFVLPGSKIGDGAVVGANSVVHNHIPPRCLALGFPARVVSKAPEFPKEVTDEQKVNMFRNIVAEMTRFFVDSGLSCRQDGDCYELRKSTRGWLNRNQGPWTLLVVEGDVREATRNLPPRAIHVFLSLREIPFDVRAALTARRVMWIEIANKEQSRVSNDLGDEVALFLKRYGVRTLRWPPTAGGNGSELMPAASGAESVPDELPAVDRDYRYVP